MPSSWSLASQGRRAARRSNAGSVMGSSIPTRHPNPNMQTHRRLGRGYIVPRTAVSRNTCGTVLGSSVYQSGPRDRASTNN
eukprot:354196-Chlamydomonas_euryale.AAC.4